MMWAGHITNQQRGLEMNLSDKANVVIGAVDEFVSAHKDKEFYVEGDFRSSWAGSAGYGWRMYLPKQLASDFINLLNDAHAGMKRRDDPMSIQRDAWAAHKRLWDYARANWKCGVSDIQNDADDDRAVGQTIHGVDGNSSTRTANGALYIALGYHVNVQDYIAY